MKSKKLTNKRIGGLRTKVNRNILIKSKKRIRRLTQKAGAATNTNANNLISKNIEICLMNLP